MATGSMQRPQVVPSTYACYALNKTSNGNTYTTTVTFSGFTWETRFPIIIIRGGQPGSSASSTDIAAASVTKDSIYNGPSWMSYNSSTQVLTITEASSAWFRPMILYPNGSGLSFS